MFDCIVVGAGICGLSAANYLATRGKKVLIIEQSHTIGGLCKERHYKGVRYSLYGAHIFHTNDDEVLSFLNQFTHWTYYTHTVKSFCKGKLWTIPMNYSELPEDTEWKRLILKESLYTDYSKKMWGPYYDDMQPTFTERLGQKERAFDYRYFSDKFQGFPEHGYNNMFQEMAHHKNIEIHLNRKFNIGWVDKNTPVIHTGRIDTMLNRNDLPYMTMGFTASLNGSYPWSDKYGVINFPQDYDFIRACSNKILYQQDTKNDIIVYDHPRGQGPLCYPIVYKESKDLYQVIASKVRDNYPNVIPAGRFGKFEYMDMDQAVRSGLDVAMEVLK